MEQYGSANRRIDVASYTKTTPLKIITVWKVLEALLAVAGVVLFIIYAGSIRLLTTYLIADVSASMQNVAQTGATIVLLRAFSFLLQTPVIPALIAGAAVVVEAVGYVNLVSSDHGEKPIRVISQLRMFVWLLNIIAIVLIFVSVLFHLDRITVGSVLSLILICAVCVLAPVFYYCWNRDVANIMLTIANERKSGSLQYAGGKSLLWKATLVLVLAVLNVIVPALILLFGGIGAVTDMISNIGNGANVLRSIFQAGGTVFVLVPTLIIPVCRLIFALAVHKAAQTFNKLH